MIKKIIEINKKSIDYEKIEEYNNNIKYFDSIPMYIKLMKIYYEQLNIISYNKKNIILNTWTTLLEDNTISIQENESIKKAIETVKRNILDID